MMGVTACNSLPESGDLSRALSAPLEKVLRRLRILDDYFVFERFATLGAHFASIHALALPPLLAISAPVDKMAHASGHVFRRGRYVGLPLDFRHRCIVGAAG